MKEIGTTKFGVFEKRNYKLHLDCLPIEARRWKKRYGRGLAAIIRALLNKQVEQGPVLAIPRRPHYKKLTVHLAVNCSESELFYWQLCVPQHKDKSKLGVVTCHLLNISLR